VNLNDEQKQAAEAAGSVAVTAGAGTGKTAMLSHRYLHHVRVDGYSPLAIVAVTFTDKAAAELRSRIRKVLIAENIGEKTVAELEAAQISTIHSLAARICRDHYYVAGLPPDFEIMDEIRAKLWELEKFDEAVALVDPEAVKRLGFSFMCEAVAELLKDPYRAELALEKGSDEWERLLDEKLREAWKALEATEEFAECESVFKMYSGKAGDKMEEARAAYLIAFAKAREQRSIKPIYEVRGKHTAGMRVGNAANWDSHALAQVRSAYNALLAHIPEKKEDRAKFESNPHDAKAAELIEPLAAAYRTVRGYLQREKIANKMLDFNDLELYAREILQDKKVLEHYSKRWKAVLVDEFQDTNPIQAEIIERLSEGTKLTIVGDEKQSIYGFRGADVEVFGRFREHIVERCGGSVVVLDRSYRTHAELVDISNKVFAHLLGPLHQKLSSERDASKSPPPAPPHISLTICSGDGNTDDIRAMEAQLIADNIAELLSSGVRPRDIAILSRAWAPLDIYMDALSERGIPATHFGGGSLLETREAADIYSLLQFVCRPEDNLPLVALLRSPFFAVSDTRLLKVALPYKDTFVWWDAIRSDPEFSEETALLEQFIAKSRTLSADELVAFADDATGYSAVIANLPLSRRRMADLVGTREFIRELASEGRADVFGVVRSFRELIRAEAEVPRPQLEAGDAVSLMTIHKAKGLEWNYVFVPDLDRQSRGGGSKLVMDSEIGVAFSVEGEGHEREKGAVYELIRHRQKESEEKELRRLIYVALTRAKDSVYLSSAGEGGRGLTALKLLRPALEAAGIAEKVEIFESAEHRPVQLAADREDIAVESLLGEIPAVPASVTATGLSVYAKCPKQFRYQFIEDHPGIAGEGGSNAAKIGKLTHEALEMFCFSVDQLRDITTDATDEELADAIRLADVFRNDPKFASVRSDIAEFEVPFRIEANGLNIHGKADYVTDDAVLDFKTDAEMHPDEHRFQLWAYARAFGKNSAYIAYLRIPALHPWKDEEFAQIESEAEKLISRILAGDHRATPSERICMVCPYRLICGDAAA
jgi:ATP-dependent helicase/nuclease subunit A